MGFWQKLLQGRYLRLPIHPIVVHFPIALFTTALIFDLISFSNAGTPFAIAAYYTIWAGVISGIIAIFFGFVEYLYETPPGSDVFWTATSHAIVSVAAETIFIINLTLRFNNIIAPTPALPVILSIVGVGLMFMANTLGSYMVFIHGVRVRTIHDHESQAKEWQKKKDTAA